MRKLFIVLNLMAIVAFVTIFGMCYFAAVHPLLTVGAGIVGINLMVFTMFKLG